MKRVLRSSKLPIADWVPAPMMRSPPYVVVGDFEAVVVFRSPSVGRSRPPAPICRRLPAGRSRIMTMSGKRLDGTPSGGVSGVRSAQGMIGSLMNYLHVRLPR